MPKYFVSKRTYDSGRPVTLHAGANCPFLRGESMVLKDVEKRTTKKCGRCTADNPFKDLERERLRKYNNPTP